MAEISRIVILGGPGDGIVVAQTVRDLAAAGAPVAVHGFLNDAVTVGTLVHGLPVLGTLPQWRELDGRVQFVAALHKVKQMESRSARIAELAIPEARWATVIHPTARVADGVRPGAGTYIGPYVTVQPGATVGRHVSVRAGANVGHDAVLEDFSYMGPNSTLCGRAALKHGAHLGPNACVLDGITVGRYAVVGLCSAVTKNVDDGVVCIGVPARAVARGAGEEER